MASYAVPNVLGGEISQAAQGRFDKPDYRTSLNVCLNGFPVEIGPWSRRGGTRHAGTTLNGAPGRVMEFDFQQSAAITNEFTDGFLRFRSGPNLITVNGTATIHTLTTPYIGGSWASIRAVQAETTQILLAPTVAPQALTVTTKPAPGINPQFALAPAVFNDGPYLDPPINGVQVTPGSTSGLVTLTLSFPTYDATKAYAAGAFVTSGGVNYVSQQDQNVGNAVNLAAWWLATSAGAAINDGKGFLGTDTGRLVRLFSEPAPYVAGSSYIPASVVSYNPTGQPGATTYWQSQVTSSATVAPGTDLTTWKIIPQGAALWTWGKITGLSSVINPAPSGAANIGDMTVGGGLAAAFDGVFSQAAGASAEASTSGLAVPFNFSLRFSSFVGKNYTGASNQKIASATVYPSNDTGFVAVTGLAISSITLNLRGKASAPGSASDGTLLGSSGGIGNTFSAVGITSNDQSTAWAYVWIEMIVLSVAAAPFGPSPFTYSLSNAIAELSLFNPAGTGTSAGCTVEILGPPLLSTTSIRTWRLGVYSNTTGWPTCGVYNDGRLYLGGAVGNRFDACVSNGIVGAAINFAPTDQYGAVSPAAAFSYVFNSDGVNPILWMVPDLQGIKCGTQAGEWLIQAPTAGSIAPNNITARNVTNHGGANIQPCRTEHTTVFVQRYARKLLEYFPDVYSGKFSAPNLADKAEHLTAAGVAELAYTSAVTPIIWGRDTAGSLFGITYKRDSLASSQPPTFYGWHRHALGSGRIIESICSGPSVGGNLDALTMVTNDPATNVRHVEILTDTPNELSALANAWQLDDAVNPSLTVSSDIPIPLTAPYGGLTLSGLDHLNGKTVQVFAGGLDCGDIGDNNPLFSDFTVSNGAVFVPYGDGVSAGTGKGLFTKAFAAALLPSQIVVGFTFTSQGQLVRPVAQADTGARNGPAFGKLRRIHRMAAQVVNTLGLWVGTDFTKLVPAPFKQKNTKAIPPLTTFSGLFELPPNDEDSYDGMMCWQITRPFPATIVAIGANLDTKDQ
jgi:hypothetical protein